jgi:hypothetical protein
MCGKGGLQTLHIIPDINPVSFKIVLEVPTEIHHEILNYVFLKLKLRHYTD